MKEGVGWGERRNKTRMTRCCVLTAMRVRAVSRLQLSGNWYSPSPPRREYWGGRVLRGSYGAGVRCMGRNQSVKGLAGKREKGAGAHRTRKQKRRERRRRGRERGRRKVPGAATHQTFVLLMNAIESSAGGSMLKIARVKALQKSYWSFGT